METLEEKIKKLEEEIRQTPYHKGTQHHIGRLRARIAKLKEEVIQRTEKGKRGGGVGFAQKKFGDATVVLLGPPSVGKSTLLNKLTNAQSKVAQYDFTTLNVIPGMMEYQGAKIQIFDIPGIIGGAVRGKGRGREILSVARVADLIILLTDISTYHQIPQIQKELSEAGLRLNQKKPEIIINKKLRGGITVVSSSLSPKTVSEIAKEFRLSNAEIIIKGTVAEEQLIDALIGNRVYLPYLVVLNKIDLVTKTNLSSMLGELAKYTPSVILISAENGTGVNILKEKIWDELRFMRVYLKPGAGKPDFENPLILKSDETVLDAAQKIHGELVESIKGAKIWGKSAKFPGQKVSLTHQLEEGNMLTFLLK